MEPICAGCAQIRANAPDAYIVVLGLPDDVLSALRGSAAAALYRDSLNRAVQDLQTGGFQRLTLLQLPDAQVGPLCSCMPCTLCMNVCALLSYSTPFPQHDPLTHHGRLPAPDAAAALQRAGASPVHVDPGWTPCSLVPAC